jgi:NADH dehydrogenase FAD-containing subunit
LKSSSLTLKEPSPPSLPFFQRQAQPADHKERSVVNDLFHKGRRHAFELEEFKPDIKGTVASLGEHNAVGVVYGRKLKGMPASCCIAI